MLLFPLVHLVFSWSERASHQLKKKGWKNQVKQTHPHIYRTLFRCL